MFSTEVINIILFDNIAALTAWSLVYSVADFHIDDRDFKGVIIHSAMEMPLMKSDLELQLKFS